jgi:N6-L-threonylcarbamoyladenine synthase
MTLLAIETSCDETSAAVVRGDEVLSNVVSSQIKLHAEYGGVVPELAARGHLRNLMPVVSAALTGAALAARQLDAVAATQGPGLPGALLIGFKAAQALAFVLHKPFIGIQHHEAHLYSPWIAALPSAPTPQAGEKAGVSGGKTVKRYAADFTGFEPNVSLIVSGGHTMLVRVAAEQKHHLLGATLDDAAGECFDKTGKLIGLPYPAGPEIDRLAETGNPKAFNFPRPLLNDPSDDFSFSGLKTSVRYFLRDHPQLREDPRAVCDLCASVQAAIVEVLVTKTVRAAKRSGVRCVTAAGGVVGNRALRKELAAACAHEHLTLRLADPNLASDNAAMIGVLAGRKLARGMPATPFDSEIVPNWALG